jgi:hypothetical protein
MHRVNVPLFSRMNSVTELAASCVIKPMWRPVVSSISGILFASIGAFAQTQAETGMIRSGRGAEIPSLATVKQFDWSAHKGHSRSGFLKNLTVESFGFDLSPTGQGYESPLRFTNSPSTANWLECPRCIARPAMERSRFTLPPFGAQATLPLWHERAELFTGFGGVNGWKPDNTLIEPGRRGTSFNDAWLLQGEVGARVAVDHGRHLWLGPVGRYVSNFGEGKKHWNTFGGTATFRLGP